MKLIHYLRSAIDYITPMSLSEYGVLGMNARNLDFINSYNPRKFYPLVDNKLLTKKKAIEAGITVPELYHEVSFIHDIKKTLYLCLEHTNGFVIKPASGTGGGGIVIINRIKNGTFFNQNQMPMSKKELGYHMTNILAGLYSLGGRPDHVMIERRIIPHKAFQEVTYKGVADLRIIVFKGYPVMGMLRLPTRSSDGKANLHQGGIGVGINLATGLTNYGVSQGRYVQHHHDTNAPLINLEIPFWQEALRTTARISHILPLGYLGCDFILDQETGLNLIEVNARPGLAIQIANKAGLKPRLERILAHDALYPDISIDDKIEFSKQFGQ